ncbi:MAG TPA: YcaO-like family protein, partial [Candidatus Paceibacterota bacterium]
MVVEREQEEQLTLFTPFPRIRFIPETVAREELLRPCGRFHSVVPKETRLIGAIRERLLARERDDSFVSVPGMPLSWRAMLEYLHEHELIAEPGFHLPLFDNSHPKTFSLRLRPYPDKDSTDARNATYNAFASGRDIERVMERVVGEVLERRFLRQYHASDLVAASADEMRGRGLDLDTLNGFAPFQLEAVPLGARDDHAPLLWERGYEVQTGRRTYLPAQLVYWSYAQGKDGERILGDSTTSGCAGHFTREEALLSALLELIERDGFLIYWLNMLSPRVIEVARSPDPSIRRLLAYLERYRIRPYFLDTTTDIGIPSLVCVVVDELSGSRIGIGGACGFDL